MEMRSVALLVALLAVHSLFTAAKCYQYEALQHAVNGFKLLKLQLAYELREVLRDVQGLRIFLQPLYANGPGPLYPLPYRRNPTNHRFTNYIGRPERMFYGSKPQRDQRIVKPLLEPHYRLH